MRMNCFSAGKSAEEAPINAVNEGNLVQCYEKAG